MSIETHLVLASGKLVLQKSNIFSLHGEYLPVDLYHSRDRSGSVLQTLNCALDGWAIGRVGTCIANPQ